MYERRLKILLAIMAAGVAVLLVRLVDLQLIRGHTYRARAEAKLVWVELLPTTRGRLLDRFRLNVEHVDTEPTRRE